MPGCQTPHPEDAQRTCILPSEVPHGHHSDQQGDWPNTELLERVEQRKKRKPTTRRQRTEKLAQFTGARKKGHFTKEEGMEAALYSTDTEQAQQAFWSALGEVARTRETFTSDHVWDLLLSRGFEYEGSRQFVGPMMSRRAPSAGLAESTGEKVESRSPFAHSGLPVTVYRSLVYRG